MSCFHFLPAWKSLKPGEGRTASRRKEIDHIEHSRLSSSTTHVSSMFVKVSLRKTYLFQTWKDVEERFCWPAEKIIVVA